MARAAVAVVALVALVAGAAAHDLTQEEARGAYMTAAFQGLVDAGIYNAPVMPPPETADLMAAGTIRPVVLMHGLGDAGDNPGMQSLATSIMQKYPGSYATAVNVANGLASFFTKMQDQVDQFAKVVQADPKLANGFNVVGLSQGGLVVRGYIQQYNNPPVHNFVSICGVQNGVYNCPLEVQIIPFVCDWFKSNPYHFLLNGSIPLSFSDYWVDSMNRTEYVTENRFLPYMNNQREVKNPKYKSNLESLNLFYMVEATKDTVVYPYESEQFGGYKWNTKDTIYNMTEGGVYTNDFIGLKELNEAGKIQFNSYAGQHVQFPASFWNKVILPLFNN